jgi:hypothetical protein
MPGNFANTYFANQLALRNIIIREINEIDTGRIINVISGKNTKFSIDDDTTPNNYELYIPAPGILQAASNQTDSTTSFTIDNPNNLHVEFRVADWFGGAPTSYISEFLFPNFSSQTSSIIRTSSTITFKLYQNPSNSTEKAWFFSV